MDSKLDLFGFELHLLSIFRCKLKEIWLLCYCNRPCFSFCLIKKKIRNFFLSIEISFHRTQIRNSNIQSTVFFLRTELRCCSMLVCCEIFTWILFHSLKSNSNEMNICYSFNLRDNLRISLANLPQYRSKFLNKGA